MNTTYQNINKLHAMYLKLKKSIYKENLKDKGDVSMNITYESINKLHTLCFKVKELINEGNYNNSIELICEAMRSNPNSPEPHNLLGIIFEKKGDHSSAMKHFRAAYALDPSYKPAKYNLDTFGTFFSGGGFAFDEKDLRKYDSLEKEPQNLGYVLGRRK
ncbi:MAG: tetratricopeptide repeat protein [Tissierellia bacterium]|nr:tetratricopeptide repeat protein [Tissierellia bacterium]